MTFQFQVMAPQAFMVGCNHHVVILQSLKSVTVEIVVRIQLLTGDLPSRNRGIVNLVGSHHLLLCKSNHQSPIVNPKYHQL